MHNSEFVDATDLDAWAQRREAQEVLPRLIRSLLISTPGITGVSVRASDGIGVPGWDGHADGGAGTAYVPSGASQWELGTSNDPRDQAQRNYRKRTDDPHGVNPASTAFVFATLRRWGTRDHKDDKDAWVRERQAEGKWREVVALDADDLEGWLETTPNAHIWLSERMGRRPLEVQTLDLWWETWSTRTRPALPAELLLAGRRHKSQELRQVLQGTADVIGLYGGSRDEAIAFLAASLAVTDEREAYAPGDDPLATVLVVSTSQTWARLAASPSRAILVPDFDGADVAVAVRSGQHVLVPMGSGDDKDRARIVLPRLARNEARDALQAAGWSFERADRYAAQARRSLRSLRRELAVNPIISRPAWARRPAADPFAPLILVGGWSSDSPADCDMVAVIVSREYARLDRDLAEWEAGDDPPFHRSGTSWRLAAPLDAWTLLRPVLTTDDLTRWHDAALNVLTEPDPSLGLPPSDRPFAALRGARRRWSNDLRRGLAQGAALLGAAGDAPFADSRSGPDHAGALVSELLTTANGDVTGHVWQSLADVLPLLAEAAPQQFLDGVEAGLAGDPPLLRLIFTDSQDTTPLGVSSPHAELLWALETLCWSQEYLSRAADALARLAEIDPGGRLANRPSASLRSVLLPWMPQTSAPLRRRLAVVGGLLNRRPGVGWPLLLGLLPHMHDGSQNTHAPMFRDWTPNEEQVPLTELLEAVHELLDQALTAAAQRPRRWVQLVDRLQDLPVEEFNRSLDALENVGGDALDPDDRFALWTTITELAAQHRQFSTAKWALADEPLKRLEGIAARLEPVHTVERYARLFDWHPNLPGTAKSDHAGYNKVLDDARRASVRATLELDGTTGLIRLAEKSKLPQLVGRIAANVGGEDLTMQLLPGLAAEGPHREIAIGWVFRMSEVHGWDWVHRAIGDVTELPESARAVFYLSLPAEPNTWVLVDADAQPIQDEYYRKVSTFGVTVDNATALAERLLERGRPWSAIDLLAFQCHGNDPAAKPPAQIIERALRAALHSEVLETPRPGSLAYDLGVLLDNLELMGASPDTMFELEWAYFPLLEHSRAPRAVHARLATEPQLFVEAVCIAFGRTEVVGDTPSAILSGRRACYSLVHTWHRPPGAADDGAIDGTVLRTWVHEARGLFAEHGCADLGDVHLGELLSGSPPGGDGVWPAEPIRDITEDLANKNFESGLMIGKVNSRGVTWRGVYDGGKQETALATQFRSWADQVEDQWPRTGRVLRQLADGYARDARGEDVTAEARADEG